MSIYNKIRINGEEVGPKLNGLMSEYDAIVRKMAKLEGRILEFVDHMDFQSQCEVMEQFRDSLRDGRIAYTQALNVLNKIPKPPITFRRYNSFDSFPGYIEAQVEENMRRSKMLDQIGLAPPLKAIMAMDIKDWGKKLSEQMNDTVNALVMNCLMPKKEEKAPLALLRSENMLNHSYTVVDSHGKLLGYYVGNGKFHRRVSVLRGFGIYQVKDMTDNGEPSTDTLNEIPTTHAAPIKKEGERLFPLCKGENDAGCLYKIMDNSGNVIETFTGDGKPIRCIPIPSMVLVGKVKKMFCEQTGF